jgi:nitroreductase
MLKRNSVRKYTNQNIPDKVIETLLKSAMQAPSACNQQPWEFVVIDDRNILDKLSTMSSGALMLKTVHKAIAVIMTDTVKSPGMRTQDCGAATQNILLEATNQNIGSCWIGVYPLENRQLLAKELLNVPENKDVFCLVSLGYPQEEKEIELRYDESRIIRNKY